MGFFSTICETKELHENTDLRTKYFKSSFLKVKEQVERYAQANKLIVQSVNEEYGEVLLQSSSMHIVVSIIQTTPLETAVDIKVQVYTLIGMNIPKKTILKLYQYLSQNLNFKGVSLHP